MRAAIFFRRSWTLRADMRALPRLVNKGSRPLASGRLASQASTAFNAALPMGTTRVFRPLPVTVTNPLARSRSRMSMSTSSASRIPLP